MNRPSRTAGRQDARPTDGAGGRDVRATAQTTLSDVRMPAVPRRISLRGRFRIWRSYLSAPALLARFDETQIVARIAAINGGLTILTIGVFAWLTGTPLLFPALGPTAFILFSAPLSAAAAPRSVVLGHLTAIMIGFAVWWMISALTGEPVGVRSGWPPIISTSLALALTCMALVRLSCPHPPACASSLVVALGATTQWHELLLMGGAVLLLTAQAVAINRLAGVPAPRWKPRVRQDAC
jgi:CBS domain-containing membrane protein